MKNQHHVDQQIDGDRINALLDIHYKLNGDTCNAICHAANWEDSEEQSRCNFRLKSSFDDVIFAPKLIAAMNFYLDKDRAASKRELVSGPRFANET